MYTRARACTYVRVALLIQHATRCHISSSSREMTIYKPVLLEEFRVGNIVKISGLNGEVLFFAVLEYRTNSRRCLSQASAITFTQRKYNFGKV